MKTLLQFEKKLEKLNKEFEQFKKSHRTTPEIGSTVEVAGITWRVLDKTEKGYLVITESFIETEMRFDGNTNNWNDSELRSYLNTKIAEKIEQDIGAGALQEFERDLLSLDGQTEYGTCMDKVSLLTVDEYRKFRKYLPNMAEWWWLCTPYSTPCNWYEKMVTVVSPDGLIVNCDCGDFNGVRLVCIFPSSIFES